MATDPEAGVRRAEDVLREQVRALQETVTRLNRRCQIAEAAANLRAEEWGKRSTNQGRLYLFTRYREQVRALRAALEALPEAVPTNWLDPLLTGPAGLKGRFDGPEIERLLRGVQDRLREQARAVLTATEE